MLGTPKSVLILGGTTEAMDLAERLVARGNMRVATSLAGRTHAPETPAGETRIGGFGGAEGLAACMRKEGIDLVVDATHPFAVTISENAAQAVAQSDATLLSLQRPAWRPVAGDNWQSVASLQDACKAIPGNACVFLALGRQHIDAFAERTDVRFLVRMVDRPDTPLPFRSSELVIGKPSPDPQREAQLLKAHNVTLIICRNSGGSGAYAKIAAARRLSIPVIMVERPAEPAGKLFTTVDELMAAID